MNSATNDGGADRAGDTTPGTDIQPEDAGTRASGNTGRGTAAEGAMKQTSKTAAESGAGKQPADDARGQGGGREPEDSPT